MWVFAWVAVARADVASPCGCGGGGGAPRPTDTEESADDTAPTSTGWHPLAAGSSALGSAAFLALARRRRR